MGTQLVKTSVAQPLEGLEPPLDGLHSLGEAEADVPPAQVAIRVEAGARHRRHTHRPDEVIGVADVVEAGKGVDAGHDVVSAGWRVWGEAALAEALDQGLTTLPVFLEQG